MVIIFKANRGIRDSQHAKESFQFQFWLRRRPREQRKGLCRVNQMRRIAQPDGASVAEMAKGSITSVLLGASKLSPLEDTLEVINEKLRCSGLTARNSNTQLPDVYPTGLTETTAVDEELNALRK
jgi:hypothetical protein